MNNKGLLVLSRRQHQSIIIGDDIKITVVSATPVKLSIEAPRSIPVHREEIYNRIKEENK